MFLVLHIRRNFGKFEQKYETILVETQKKAIKTILGFIPFVRECDVDERTQEIRDHGMKEGILVWDYDDMGCSDFFKIVSPTTAEEADIFSDQLATFKFVCDIEHAFIL